MMNGSCIVKNVCHNMSFSKSYWRKPDQHFIILFWVAHWSRHARLHNWFNAVVVDLLLWMTPGYCTLLYIMLSAKYVCFPQALHIAINLEIWVVLQGYINDKHCLNYYVSLSDVISSIGSRLSESSILNV